ncbi:MAG: DNA mismatch repair protein MutS [Phycisphaerae bacterium]|nr:DNA mismatch repair protein MutS [Phycisphaerae bacterium]NIP52842.1 DNA mismatch repair protein MutS [Phycisphaerae bacterium]NIS51863.1 DNA mismatch repair protein MutS [Phycisphaerae bacterium]NIU09381.1 DNA mismatch repair protein MutS [Phycisphaerae bacterium]NIU57614.1 DNA mismatch repair protein MutS [Phycisphaerae bacterium]
MAAPNEKLTPAMKQFSRFKAKYPDCILFFRMGDFYETFYEDAKTCSRVCGLTLTSRSKGSNPIPLAGVPYHAVDGYLKKMIQAGYRVAVCEQVEDPKTAKGVVKRDVVRIVTPGTLTDDILLDAKEDNFLCAVGLGTKHRAAISWVDISTGHFFVQDLPEQKLLDELLRLSPAECLLPDRRGELFEAETRKLAADVEQLTRAIVTERPAWYFDPYQARQRLLKHFGTATLEGFGIGDGEDGLIPPAGAIIEYLNETQKTTLGHIQSLKKINRKKFLQIDPATLRSLEVLRTIRTETQKGSLLECLDETLTGMGARKFRSWLCMPLCDLPSIELRQDAVEELKETDTKLAEIRKLLSALSDPERIAARISTFRASPRDLVALAATLRRIPRLREVLEQLSSGLLAQLAGRCDSMDELADLLEAAIEPQCPSHLRDGGVIRAGFSEELDRLRSISKDGQSWLRNYQKQQIEQTGISNLKLGFNKVFGYYIEVNHSAADKVPPDYVRKQTIKNAERYITDELKEYETQALSAEEKALELEQQLFEEVRRQAVQYVSRLQSLADTLAQCDCLTALAYMAKRRGYIRPKITDTGRLFINEGRHPVVAEMLGAEFVPNDIELGEKAGDVLLVTGPNMSGKSTYIRQVALLALMAQAGSFIPAKDAELGLVDRIFTRVGASDELVRGQSTFMVEMTETANIINNATEKSLVILDEVGRGTSTYDGLSLAWAITEHIATKIKCRTLFATHYHELTELAELFTNVRNCNVAVREWMDEVVFLHKILPGGTDKSYGIHVAKLAGVPKSILERSKEILEELESTFQKEATGEHLSRHKTKEPDKDSLFVQKHKSVLEKLASTDINNLTPIEAINLLNQIKNEMNKD